MSMCPPRVCTATLRALWVVVHSGRFLRLVCAARDCDESPSTTSRDAQAASVAQLPLFTPMQSSCHEIATQRHPLIPHAPKIVDNYFLEPNACELRQCEDDDKSLAGFRLRMPDNAEEAGVYFRCRLVVGSGHRRQYRHFQPDQYHASAAVTL